MRQIPYFYVLLGVILLGTSGTAQTFMPQSIHPLVVGAMRLTIGGFVLLIGLVILKKISFKNWPWKETLLAALSIAIAQYFYFNSMRLTGVAIGTVVAISSAPVFSGVIESLFLKHRPTLVWMIATFFSFIGCGFLFIHQEGVVIHSTGILMALAAGFSFAIYTLFNKEVLKTVPTIPAVAVIFSMSGFILLPFLFVFEVKGIFTGASMFSILYLGIVTVSVAYTLFSRGLRFIPSSSALTLSLVEPLVATMLGVLVVGERLELISWIGVIFLLSGILVLTFSKEKVIQN